jgi:alpha-tubulin suppressor-like RCC1 family protein
MFKRFGKPELCIVLIVGLVAGMTLFGRLTQARAAGVKVPLSAGGFFACALTSSGGIDCWGRNASGELGDGTSTDRSMPVDVLGLTSGISAVSAGGAYACALTDTRRVQCWGDNSFGELGNGSMTKSSTPVALSGLTSGVAAISTGQYAACALTVAGGVKCWGDNDQGQLGDGSRTGSSTPVGVSGLGSGVVAVSAGGSHSCALTVAGGVKCWGDNDQGQLGDGSRTGSSTPVGVSGLGSGVVAVSAGGSHSCALTVSGGVKCWGDNDQGQVGNGTAASTTTPVDVLGLTSGVGALSAGSADTCALTTVGDVKCWGYNDDGELGDGAALLRRSSPVDLSGLTGHAATISAGYGHACVVSVSGTVECWGDNQFGQLGDGTTISRFTPGAVAGLRPGVSAVSAGAYDTCALTNAGAVKCWGAIAWSAGGRPITSLKPVNVAGLSSGVVAISAGAYHTCALTSMGVVKCWGFNLGGELGNGTTINSSIPVTVAGLGSAVTAISAGWFHTCAVTVTGGAKCWGVNEHGELGDDSYNSRSSAAAVSGLTSAVTAISAGYDDTCAVTTAGSVSCWGGNGFGQLGDGTMASSSVPQNVSGLTSGVSVLSTGQDDSCALMTTGTVQCWGLNDRGQLGDGTTINRSVPVRVPDLNGVTALSGTCVIAANALKCWGDNASGKLGIDPGWTPVDTGESFFVATAPTAPAIRSVVPGDASAAVMFVAPWSDGGSPIVRLRAACVSRTGGPARFADGSRSPIVVSELGNADTYTCTVTATNAVGKRALSAPSRRFVPRASLQQWTPRTYPVA